MNQIHAYAPVEVKVVLVANKIDLERERVITTEEGKKVAAKYGLPFFECSAQTGINIQEVFQRMGSEVLEKVTSHRFDTIESLGSGNLDAVKSKGGTKKCC
jgi:GTPase SAR1 family protein